MSDLPADRSSEPLLRLAQSVEEYIDGLREVIRSQAADLLELRGDVAELGTRIALESELRAIADEKLGQEGRDLDRRLTDVHAKALRAINARYAPKETA